MKWLVSTAPRVAATHNHLHMEFSGEIKNCIYMNISGKVGTQGRQQSVYTTENLRARTGRKQPWVNLG